jgi:hypothetical protein
MADIISIQQRLEEKAVRAIIALADHVGTAEFVLALGPNNTFVAVVGELANIEKIVETHRGALRSKSGAP